MSTTLTTTPAVRFHISLNVRDLGRSVEFYRILFGTEPAKRRPDYAKFESDDPPLVLSLEPSAAGTGGALNHLGFRMGDAESLVRMQERLKLAGIHSRREDGVECCYARQSKFWVHDTDGTLWEVYTLDGDIEHRGTGQSAEAVLPAPPVAEAVAQLSWEHRLGDEVPVRIPLSDAAADEIRLRGTLNVPLPEPVQDVLVREANRVLKPGGRLFVHVLVGDRPLSQPPSLPGPAAAVQHVPVQSEPVRLLERNHFRDVRMLKFDAHPCFVRHGVLMRELQLEGYKEFAGGKRPAAVLYKGPLAQVVDDAGTEFRRGEWVLVPEACAARRAGAESDRFVIANSTS